MLEIRESSTHGVSKVLRLCRETWVLSRASNSALSARTDQFLDCASPAKPCDASKIGATSMHGQFSTSNVSLWIYNAQIAASCDKASIATAAAQFHRGSHMLGRASGLRCGAGDRSCSGGPSSEKAQLSNVMPIANGRLSSVDFSIMVILSYIADRLDGQSPWGVVMLIKFAAILRSNN
jgi:hypothetical protein